MSSKLVYVDETSSSRHPMNPDSIEPRRPAEVSGNDCSQPGNSPSAPGPASRPSSGPASQRTSAHNDRGCDFSTLPSFNRVRCESTSSLECLSCFLRRTEAQEKEKFLKKPIFYNELLRNSIRPVISTFDPEPANPDQD